VLGPIKTSFSQGTPGVNWGECQIFVPLLIGAPGSMTAEEWAKCFINGRKLANCLNINVIFDLFLPLIQTGHRPVRSRSGQTLAVIWAKNDIFP
jgi:hypothetical protein